MNLYLSSYRLGSHIETLNKMVNPKRHVAIIENAIDFITHQQRELYQKTTFDIYSVFKKLGYHPLSIDLRKYFDKNDLLENELKKYDLIWVCGGNVFLLRKAMKQSGFDKIIKHILTNNNIVYGGWSAGACIASPSLKGIELCDNPDINVPSYQKEIIWDGLGLIDYAIAPHYKSDHPETKYIDNVITYFNNNNIHYKKLRDGDVLIINDETHRFLKYEDGASSSLNLDKI